MGQSANWKRRKRAERERMKAWRPPEAKWTPFEAAKMPEDRGVVDDKIISVWMNSRYQVNVYATRVEEMGGAIITWLSIKRLDKGVVYDWRDMQRIKNELCGESREGMQMFPSEDRLVDASNQYHMFVLPPGQMWPFGYNDRLVVAGHDYTDRPEGGSRQAPFPPGEEPQDILTAEESDELIRSAPHVPARSHFVTSTEE